MAAGHRPLAPARGNVTPPLGTEPQSIGQRGRRGYVRPHPLDAETQSIGQRGAGPVVEAPPTTEGAGTSRSPFPHSQQELTHS